MSDPPHLTWDTTCYPPAMLMALDNGADSHARLPRHFLACWEQVLKDAETLAAPASQNDQSVHVVPPSASKPCTQQLDTAEFFALSAELERVNRDIQQSRPVELHERVKNLAVDELDLHMFDTLAPSQRADGRRALQLFTAQQYEDALQCMLHVVSACAADKRTAAMCNNEAACYFKLERWLHSRYASERALDLYRGLEVCQRRLTRIHLAMGDLAAAKREALAFKHAPQWANEWRAIKAYEAYTVLLESQQYTHALRELESLLAVFPCATFESLKVQLISLESTPEAMAYALKVRVCYPFSVDLQFWQTELAFHSASSSSDLHEVIKMCHGATAAKTDTRFRLTEVRVRASLSVLTHVEELARECRWEPLVAACTQSLEKRHMLHDGMKLALYSSRAAAYTHLQNWYAGLDDACRAMGYAEMACKKADLLLLASECEEGLQRFADALGHAQQSQRLLASARAAHRILHLQARLAQDAQRRQAKKEEQSRPPPSNTCDPESGDGSKHQSHRSSSSMSAPQASVRQSAEVLGLKESATALEVRRAYRALAMRWHPDKWSGATAHELSLAEQRFKEMQHAYETIMNTIAS